MFFLELGSVSSPLCVCETRKRYVVKHNLITEVYLMTVMETTTCFGLYWPKHVVVSITVIKYTSVIKLCLVTYLFLVLLRGNNKETAVYAL